MTMGLFKRYSNDSNEYVIFSEYKRKLEMLLNEDSFISKKWFLGIYNEINEVFNKWWTNKPKSLILISKVLRVMVITIYMMVL